MFPFLYVKANSKEICEKYRFPAFFRKMLSAFLLGFNANYLETNVWLPVFSFVDSNSPCKDLLFLRGPNLAQKPLYLVGTVLKVIPLKLSFYQTFFETWRNAHSCYEHYKNAMKNGITVLVYASASS